MILLNSSDKIFQCGEFQWGMLGKRKHGDFRPERGSSFSQILLLSILEAVAVVRDWKRYKLFEETSHSTIGCYTKLCQSAFVCQLSKSVELKFLDRVCAGGDWCWSS